MTVIVEMRHIRAANLCASGARAWFQSHQFDWSEFLSNGMSADRLEATKDELAFKVTKIAREEQADGQQRR